MPGLDALNTGLQYVFIIVCAIISLVLICYLAFTCCGLCLYCITDDDRLGVLRAERELREREMGWMVGDLEDGDDWSEEEEEEEEEKMVAKCGADGWEEKMDYGTLEW